ncbi:MAG TPA: GntR family transcriptional regulator [Trebonia sp.]|jgi:DNA-binding GntR family transcriptional regulator|nr:GntR family transcriptional regulator [Trebonia sp.]
MPATPQPEPPQPEALLEYAQRRIKTAIADGTIAPGARLSPSVLAAEFGISHIPIREALTYLSAMGFVEHPHRLGFFARTLTSEDIADIYHWRAVLENEAYVMAVPKITDEDLAQMRRLAKATGKKVKPDERLEFVRVNREFHFVAFRRAGSERLIRFLEYLWDLAEPYMNAEPVDSSRSYADHLAVIDLFAARDTQGVIDLMSDHRRVRIDHIAKLESGRKLGARGPKTKTPSVR